MSAYKAISLKKQQKSKYNLCKHQFRGNLKIKNSSISPKRLVGIKSNLSYHVLLNFLDYKSLSELLKNFSYITLKRKRRVFGNRPIANCFEGLLILIGRLKRVHNRSFPLSNDISYVNSQPLSQKLIYFTVNICKKKISRLKGRGPTSI